MKICEPGRPTSRASTSAGCNGVQLRGEWITGQPFDGTTTSGWYADLMLHRTFMGPVTAVARIERLDYDGEVVEFDEAARRQTIGARIRLRDTLSLNVNVLHHTGSATSTARRRSTSASPGRSAANEPDPPVSPSPRNARGRRGDARHRVRARRRAAHRHARRHRRIARARVERSRWRRAPRSTGSKTIAPKFAAAQAALVTTLPVFRAHLTDSQLAADRASMQVLADQYRQQLKAAFCIVTGRDGTWSGSSGWPGGPAPPTAIGGMITASASGQPRRDIAEVGDRLFLVVSEPARFAEETLGTLTVGYAPRRRGRAAARGSHALRREHRRGPPSGRQQPDRRWTDRARQRSVAADRPLLGVGRQSTRRTRVGSGEYIAGAFPLVAGPYRGRRPAGAAAGLGARRAVSRSVAAAAVRRGWRDLRAGAGRRSGLRPPREPAAHGHGVGRRRHRRRQLVAPGAGARQRRSDDHGARVQPDDDEPAPLVRGGEEARRRAAPGAEDGSASAVWRAASRTTSTTC